MLYAKFQFVEFSIYLLATPRTLNNESERKELLIHDLMEMELHYFGP